MPYAKNKMGLFFFIVVASFSINVSNEIFAIHRGGDYQGYDDVMEACQKCVDRCTVCRDVCDNMAQGGHGKNLKQGTKECCAVCYDCIASCRECIDWCKYHMKHTRNKEDNRRMDRCIRECKRCVSACENCIRKCGPGAIDMQRCMDACRRCAEACDMCINACNDCIEMTNAALAMEV